MSSIGSLGMSGVKVVGIGLGMALALLGRPVQALPGQSSEEVALWIRTHPTLQPARNETLLVRKSNTPAQRFTFQASLLPIGRLTPGRSSGVIRSEELTFVDLIHGVSRNRLQEALRVIYGPSVYQDYRQATVLYTYPQPGNPSTAFRGEVREGDRYAYWLELTQRPDGFIQTGKAIVFLREDLPKLKAELLR